MTANCLQAYKRNPMRSERLCSLGRHLQNLPKDALDTYSAQWFERSLDDSAIRRISIPELYLCADACLILLSSSFPPLAVGLKSLTCSRQRQLRLCGLPRGHQAPCQRRASLHGHVSYISSIGVTQAHILLSENVIMACVKKGLSRQDAHEEIRKFHFPLLLFIPPLTTLFLQVSSPTKPPTTSRSTARTTTSSSASAAPPSLPPSSPSSTVSLTPAPLSVVPPSRCRSSPPPRLPLLLSRTPPRFPRPRPLLFTFNLPSGLS